MLKSPAFCQKSISAMPKLDYDVCGRCGALFDDQGENGWWIREGVWWHECDSRRPARIVVRKLDLKAPSLSRVA